MDNKGIKTITIRQGTGDDALKMTVQVTQEEFEKMEELRSRNPQKWPTYSLDLVKAAKDAIENFPKKSNSLNRKRLGAAIGIIIVIAGLLVYWLCFRGSCYHNDLKLLGLNGSVKSLLTMDFEADGDFAQESVVVGNPRLDNADYITFDSLGKVIDSVTIEIKESFLKEHYKYVSYEKYKDEITFHKNGNIWHQKTYDPTGNLKEEKEYYNDGRVFSQDFYEYDDKKNVTKYSHFNFTQPQFSYNTEWTYTFDNNGRVKTKIELYEDGDPDIITKYDYDKLGRVIKECERSCAYDKHGRLIKNATIEDGGFERNNTYQYFENEFVQTSIFSYNNALGRGTSSIVDHWWYDTINNRNDNHYKSINEDGLVWEYKYSSYYDSDSVCYKEIWEDKEDGPHVFYFKRIKCPHDTIVIRIDESYQISDIDVSNYHNNVSRIKKYKTQSEIQSKDTIKNELVSNKSSLGQEEYSFSDYFYDEHGNWIRRTNYNVSDSSYTITVRCIEYY